MNRQAAASSETQRRDPEFSILHCVGSIDPGLGGVSQAICSLMHPLSEKGLLNTVVSLDSGMKTFPGLSGTVHHNLGPASGPWGFSKRLRPWLEMNLASFDTVIVHGLWQYPSYAVTSVVKSLHNRCGASPPSVFIMPHGMLDPWFQRDPSRRIKAYRNWLFWKLIEQKVISRADGVLFTNQRELELAREPFYPYLPKTEFNVGLGTESPPIFEPSMEKAFRKACPELKGLPYLLFLSRIHPKKGVDLLLKAYATLSRDIDLPALVVAGPLDSKYAQDMKRLADELSLKNVSFPGMLTGDGKWGAFYGCEAFILPSHQENFGIAVVEALACGKPVLISDQVNIFHEIEGDDAGIVASDTVNGTLDLLRNFLTLSPRDQAVLGKNAKKCFQKHFAISAAAENFVAAIRSASI